MSDHLPDLHDWSGRIGAFDQQVATALLDELNAWLDAKTSSAAVAAAILIVATSEVASRSAPSASIRAELLDTMKMLTTTVMSGLSLKGCEGALCTVSAEKKGLAERILTQITDGSGLSDADRIEVLANIVASTLGAVGNGNPAYTLQLVREFNRIVDRGARTTCARIMTGELVLNKRGEQ